MKKLIGFAILTVLLNGILLALVVNGVIDLPVLTSATNPASGFVRLFFKSDGLYTRTAAGVETGPLGTGGDSWSTTAGDFTKITGTASMGQFGSTVGLAVAASDTVAYSLGTWGSGKTLTAVIEVMGQATATNGAEFLVGVRDGACSGTNAGGVYLNIWGQSNIAVQQLKCDWSLNGNLWVGEVHTTAVSLVGLRIVDDATNRKFYFCASPEEDLTGPWIQIYSEARTTYTEGTQGVFLVKTKTSSFASSRVKHFSVQ